MGVLLKEAEKKGRWLSSWPCSLFQWHLSQEVGWGEDENRAKRREPNPGRFLEKQQVRGKFKYFSQHSRSPHRRHSEEMEEVTGT